LGQFFFKQTQNSSQNLFSSVNITGLFFILFASLTVFSKHPYIGGKIKKKIKKIKSAF